MTGTNKTLAQVPWPQSPAIRANRTRLSAFTPLSNNNSISISPSPQGQVTMKHTRPKNAAPSSSTPPISKVTVYQCIGIALVVLNHLLDDHPRHIRYRETQTQTQKQKQKQDPRTVTPPPRPQNPFTEPYPRPPSPPLRRRKSSFSRSDPPRDHHLRGRRENPRTSSTPFKPDTNPSYAVHPSRSEMRTAWSRLRAVTPTKRVRWGTVQTFVFDDGEDQVYGRANNAVGKEVWGPLEEGSVWGSTRDYGVWGNV